MVYLPLKGCSLFLLILFASSVLCYPSEAEIFSLIELYNSTQGDAGWSPEASNSWVGDPDPCMWFGVKCDTDKTTVLELTFQAVGLGGTLTSLSNLVNLTSLYVSYLPVYLPSSFQFSLSKQPIRR